MKNFIEKTLEEFDELKSYTCEEDDNGKGCESLYWDCKKCGKSGYLYNGMHDKCKHERVYRECDCDNLKDWNELKNFLKSKLEEQQEDLKKKIEGMEIPPPENLTAASTLCSKCGWNNDHSQCVCQYNQAIKDVLKLIRYEY
jgi:hypothetical protein